MGNLEINKNFSMFKNKRVLITGDTGFKGSWLSLWLSMLGAKVYGFALPPEGKYCNYNSIGLKNIINHTDGDIREIDSLQKAFDKIKPEIVFHLAAQALVRKSYNEPKLTFDTNLSGSINVMEAALKTKSLKALVMITSDKCYKNKEWLWGYRENDEFGGDDPYSASKAAAEIAIHSYKKSFFDKINTGFASARAGNVIGGGDWSENRIIPDTIKALSQKKSVIVRNPNSTRPWQHVLEPLSGYITLASKLLADPKKYSGSWNFGPDSSSIKTVHELVKLAITQWGSGKIDVIKEKNAPHEAGLLHLNCDKANSLLKWNATWGFKTSVINTIDWYKEFAKKSDMLEVSKKQIKKYMGGETLKCITL